MSKDQKSNTYKVFFADGFEGCSRQAAKVKVLTESSAENSQKLESCIATTQWLQLNVADTA